MQNYSTNLKKEEIKKFLMLTNYDFSRKNGNNKKREIEWVIQSSGSCDDENLHRE